ncbi:MAG TPA: polyprenyl synthetase family protein [Acidimicrobiales bacterium]|nr:polyprenyl synthetase family protein [Acidimicrobiales bacterium]
MASPLLTLPSMGADLGRVEQALRSSVVTDDAFLTEVASHLILAGGKRLRPALAIAVAAAVSAGNVEASQDVVMGATSVELVHLGSLYHDDVIDEAATRRTVESVNARWGNLRAILAGDFLLAKASEIAASLGTEVAGLLAATIGRLCEGEIGELQSAFEVDRTEADYYASVEGKTSALFATAARIGALVAGHDRPLVDAATTYGLRLGTAFQIVDDILDLTASEAELGKPTGHDLYEGVYTLPVLLTLSHDSVASGELRDLLGRPIEGVELEKALGIVRSNGGIPGAGAAARAQVDEAITALDVFPSTPAVAALKAGAQHLVSSLPS